MRRTICIALTLLSMSCGSEQDTARRKPSRTMYTESDCWSGALIIGEGAFAGKVEMLGCPTLHVPKTKRARLHAMRSGVSRRSSPRTRSFLLLGPDAAECYRFPVGFPNREAYCVTLHRFSPPHFGGRSGPTLFPLYDIEGWLRGTKGAPATPLEIQQRPKAALARLERIERTTGRLVGEGDVWHLLPKCRQAGLDESFCE